MDDPGRAAEFVDSGRTLSSYMGQVFCICPSCGGTAVASSESRYAVPWTPTTGFVQCHDCVFAKSLSEAKWQGPVLGTASRRCAACGGTWLHAEILERSYTRSLQSRVARRRCSRCDADTDLQLRWSPYAHPERTLCDPVFGLKLLLVEQCSGRPIWVFNREHLFDLSSFISAKHRKRGCSWKYSMVVNLPSWMKEARNREPALKALSRLDRRLSDVEA